ncbi:lactate dehydrogenase [Bacillaceae bacterium Marseille-Q3522]|nr:lactate dehydrogenase [Bacillaceae bacterium Marseille-Q3522]
MTVNVTCYGVRDVEVEFFNKLNKYDYNLTIVKSSLNDETIEKAKNADAVIIRASCKANGENIKKLAGYGVKYVLTRTVGFNHVDLNAAKENDIKVARVPAYSPNAIAELAVTLSMMLLRHTAHATARTKVKDMTIDSFMFSKEIRNCTVGILGAGRIGLTAAKLFKGLGAKLVAYDIFQSDQAKEVVEFLPLDEVLATSDVISMHLPYIKGENYHMVNGDFLNKMKDGAILVNTSRGELQDAEAILKAVESGKLGGYGTDVFENETTIFFKNWQEKPLPNLTVEKLISLYPKVLVTPHIGSYTDQAVTNMVEISYDNLNDFLTSGECKNEVK